MRNIFLMLLMALMVTQVYAADDVIKFAGVQQECAQVGNITFGPDGRWASCHVTRGRWVATLDFMDLYQAQYCLGHDAKTCDKRALVIFANRAYTLEAKALLVRIDDGATEYDDPMVVISENESIMSISARSAAGVEAKHYYLWRTDHWVVINTEDWLRGLSAYLPEGASIRGVAWPDLETMSAQVSLFRTGDADCCPSGGKANVEFGLVKEAFAVKQVKVSTMGK